jgi:hypothetical protein
VPTNRKWGGKRYGAGRKARSQAGKAFSKLERLRIAIETETVLQNDRTPLPHPDLDHDEIASAREVLHKRGEDAAAALDYIQAELDHKPGLRVGRSARPTLPDVCKRVADKHGVTERQVRRWRQEYLDTKKR